MSLGWDESYLGQLRALAGERTLIAMGASCIVRDEDRRVLLIRRSDNGKWALPSGTMELGETVRDCAVREVREETGLVAAAITPFGLYSDPRHHPDPNMWGFTYQHITLACRVDSWSGELQRVTDESVDAAFFAPDELPAGDAADVRNRGLLADLVTFEQTGVFHLE